LIGPNANNTWNVTGMNAGTLSGASIPKALSFSSIHNLTGGSANDTFVFQNGQGITGKLDGGGGTNTLDESAYTTNVIGDLQTSTATGVGGAVSHIQDVIGGNGPGYNILVGDGGNKLVGGNSRNLLIAGSKSSTLIGGSDDDILIGGTTSYDTNIAALMALMSEWTWTDETYSTRVDHIMGGGGLNGSIVLNVSTVTGNGGGNTLDGGLGLNLFFGSLTLDTTDRTPSETFISI
jgi:hypothetical protein